MTQDWYLRASMKAWEQGQHQGWADMQSRERVPQTCPSYALKRVPLGSQDKKVLTDAYVSN